MPDYPAAAILQLLIRRTVVCLFHRKPLYPEAVPCPPSGDEGACSCAPATH